MRKTIGIFLVIVTMLTGMGFKPSGHREGLFDIVAPAYWLGFIDFNSLIIMGVILVGGALLSIPLGKLLDAFIVGFGTTDLPEERGLAAYDVFDRLSKLSIAGGLVGMLTGLILMLQKLHDPTLIGPSMAIALLTFLYGLFLSEFIFRTSAADALARTQGSDTNPNSNAATDSSNHALSLVRRIIGLGILVAGLLIALLLDAPLSLFLDMPSLALVVSAVIFAGLASFRIKDWMTALSSLLSMKTLAENNAIMGYLAFRRLADVAVGAGVLGTVIGLVKMLQAMDDPSHIGPAMAVALCTSFYGVVLSELFFHPIAIDMLARGGVTRDVGQRGQEWRLMHILGGLFLVLLTFFIMLIAMADFS